MTRPERSSRITGASDPLPTSLSPARLREVIGPTRVEENLDSLSEHLSHGDTRAAVVLQTSPLIVAAYTDELDCIVPLRFRDELVGRYRLKERSRLLTANTYEYRSGKQIAPDLLLGERGTEAYRNLRPVIVDFLSDDIEMIEDRKRNISEDEWKRAEALGWAWASNPARLAPRDGDPFRSGLPVIPGIRFNGPLPERKDSLVQGFGLRIGGAVALLIPTIFLAMVDGGGVFAFMVGMWVFILFPWQVGTWPRRGLPTQVLRRPGLQIRTYRGWKTAAREYPYRDGLAPAQELRISGTNFFLRVTLVEGYTSTLAKSVREDLEELVQDRRKRLVQIWEATGKLAGIPCAMATGRTSEFDEKPWEYRAWAAWQGQFMISACLTLGPGTCVSNVERCLETLELT